MSHRAEKAKYKAPRHDRHRRCICRQSSEAIKEAHYTTKVSVRSKLFVLVSYAVAIGYLASQVRERRRGAKERKTLAFSLEGVPILRVWGIIREMPTHRQPPRRVRPTNNGAVRERGHHLVDVQRAVPNEDSVQRELHHCDRAVPVSLERENNLPGLLLAVHRLWGTLQ